MADDADILACEVRNPLVAMLTMGEYKQLPDISDSARRDAANIVSCCHFAAGYDVIYAQATKTKGNIPKTVLLDENKTRDNYTPEENYKLYWIDDEIDEFNDVVSDLLKKYPDRYDGLLYLLSGHGDDEGVAYDCEGVEVPVNGQIFGCFHGESCPPLINKPKIFIVDICRGKMRHHKLRNELYKGDVTDDNFYLEPDPNLEILRRKSKNDSDHDEKSENKSNDENINDRGVSRQTNTKVTKPRYVNVVESPYFVNESFNIAVYANTTGYAVVEGNKGGYLIRSFTKALITGIQVNKPKTFYDFILQVGQIMEALQQQSPIRDIIEYVSSASRAVLLYARGRK